jgi:hypothetical protein
MALGVEGEWKQREDGGKDYPCQPEAARMHEIYDLMLIRYQ